MSRFWLYVESARREEGKTVWFLDQNRVQRNKEREREGTKGDGIGEVGMKKRGM